VNDRSTLQVQDLGEQGLLAIVQQFCPADLVGDDAALLTVAAGKLLVVTTDLLVDGVHFSDATTSAADVGWRSTAANLSDLAAMGATPIAITVGLSLPGTVTVNWVEQLYQGMTDCLQPYNTVIAGGDICRSSVITVAIAAFGQVDPAQAIRRAVARPGDAILVTGVHGAARAGLELLLNPASGKNLDTADRSRLIQAHQRPHPRLDVMSMLRAVLPSSDLRVAGMDSSDGLADAVLQICRASGTGAILDRNQIPMPSSFNNWLTPEQGLDWALYGGEDFELVLCLPLESAKALQQRLDTAAIIGTITADPQVLLEDSMGAIATQVLNLQKGFQHFQPHSG
jgi:thiamine-monophosphate kinase